MSEEMKSLMIWPEGVSREILTIGPFQFRSYLRKPEVLITTKSPVYRITTYCTLQIQYNDKNYQVGVNPMEKAFKANLRNYMAVVNFFRTILSWFQSDKYEGLFFQDKETGRLLIDMEQRNVRAYVGGNTRFDQCAMMAVPAVYQMDAEIREGCMLTINNTKYSGMLRDVDVETICGFLSNFSFQGETLLLMQAVQIPAFYRHWDPNSRSTVAGAPNRTGDDFKPVVNWADPVTPSENKADQNTIEQKEVDCNEEGKEASERSAEEGA